MSWDEIKNLSNQLKKIQNYSPNRISERDCITIVQQLISNHDIQVYYTCDAATIFTQEQLIKEIYHELDRSCGYLDLNQLEFQLNVNRCLINTAVKLMSNSDTKLLLISLDSYLISEGALKGIIREIEEYTLNKGSTTVDDLALIFKMTSAHIVKILSHAQLDNSLIKFISEKGIVYSTAYLEGLRLKLQGYFRAAISPIQIKCVVREYDISESLALSMLEELISSKSVDGSLIHNRTKFVPECYRRCQLKCIAEHYYKEHYITFKKLAHMHLTQDHRTYLTEHFPNTIILSSLSINSEYIENSEYIKTLETYGWIDVLGYLPSMPVETFNSSDHEILINHMMRKHHNYQVVGDHFLISDSFYFNLCTFLEGKFPQKLFELSELMSKTSLLQKLIDHPQDDCRHNSKYLNDLKTKPTYSSSASSSPVIQKKLIKSFKLSRSSSRRSYKSCSPSPARKAANTDDSRNSIFFMSSQDLEKIIMSYALENFQSELDIELVMALCDKLLGPMTIKFKSFIQEKLSASSLNTTFVFEIPKDRLPLEEKILYLLSKIKLYQANILMFEPQHHRELIASLQTSEANELMSHICHYINRYIASANHQSDKLKQFENYAEQLHLASRLDLKTGEALNDILLVLRSDKEEFLIENFVEAVGKLLKLLHITVPLLNRKLENVINSTTAEALKFKLNLYTDETLLLTTQEYRYILTLCLNYLFLHIHSKIVPYASVNNVLLLYLNCLKSKLSNLDYENLISIVENFETSIKSRTYPDDSLVKVLRDVIKFVINME